MPYIIRGHCIYKKSTGKKVGCTKGDVKKYMAALHSNVKESNKYDIVCGAIALNENLEPKTPEEQARRKRMMRRMAALGLVAGLGVTGAELMAHPDSAKSIMAAAKEKGIGKKIGGVVKQTWKPMAIGAAGDLAISPAQEYIAQKMEDKYQKRKESKA